MIIASKKSIKGSIASKKSIKGSIASKKSLKGSITTKEKISGFVNVGGTIRQESYDGSYEVTPTIEQQILQTKNKTMINDLTIKSIPYSEVTNTSNGITVTIGG